MEFSPQFIMYIILSIFLASFLYTRLKVLQEHQRFAVTMLGRYEKLVGPGLLIKFRGDETRWSRISLGQIGYYLGDGIVEFDSCTIPTKFHKTPKQGVKIISFENDEVWVEPCNTFSVRCQKCGHYNKVAT